LRRGLRRGLRRLTQVRQRAFLASLLAILIVSPLATVDLGEHRERLLEEVGAGIRLVAE
jgi:hypothetical protein